MKLYNWSNDPKPWTNSSIDKLLPFIHVQELHLKAQEITEIKCTADFKPEGILLNSGI